MKRGKNNHCINCGEPCDSRAQTCVPCRWAASRIPLHDRLIAKIRVDSEMGCWVFTGFCLKNGYGRIKGSGQQVILAHRASWEVFRGTIPDGLLVLHHCDNRPCVNPDHLFLGTVWDNTHDMLAKGRDRHPKEQPSKQGELHHNARLTEAQVLEIRQRKKEPRRVLAEEFGLNRRYVSTLIRGQSWRHL
jgi:HNH endonuclease